MVCLVRDGGMAGVCWSGWLRSVESPLQDSAAIKNYWTTEVMAKELGDVPAATVPTDVRAPVAASTV